MNRIIVGFDFSSGSAYAVDLAIDIANRWHSDLRLVYVKEKAVDEAPIRAEIEQRIDAVEPLLKDIKLEYVVRQGNVVDELCAQATADAAQLMIVGTHGLSGMKTNLLGRNSYRTIEQSPVPVLIVREDFNFNKALETIVVPIDSSDDTRQKVAEAAMFAKTFGSTIHILGLYTTSAQSVRMVVKNYVAMVTRHLDKMGIKYVTKFVEAEKNLTDTTLNYADAVGADMIAIMTEQESTFKSIKLGTYAEQMVGRSTIPVLTVRPQRVQTENANY